MHSIIQNFYEKVDNFLEHEEHIYQGAPEVISDETERIRETWDSRCDTLYEEFIAMLEKIETKTQNSDLPDKQLYKILDALDQFEYVNFIKERGWWNGVRGPPNYQLKGGKYYSVIDTKEWSRYVEDEAEEQEAYKNWVLKFRFLQLKIHFNWLGYSILLFNLHCYK